jgi:uncharacterized protein (DUF427 family)
LQDLTPTENVWDYPRPPALVPCARRVRVIADELVIADSVRALRVLETSHPPTIYVPPQDVRMELLTISGGRGSLCEWKGAAHYFDVLGRPRAAWAYADPVRAYEALRDHVAFYPGRMDACLLDDEPVQAQPGDFYGGWLTSDISGPVKGGPGTLGW